MRKGPKSGNAGRQLTPAIPSLDATEAEIIKRVRDLQWCLQRRAWIASYLRRSHSYPVFAAFPTAKRLRRAAKYIGKFY